MSLACWRSVGSPTLNQSSTTLKEFDGSGFKPYVILSSFAVEVRGRTAYVEVEVVDAPLDYNIFLGRRWFYTMIFVTSSVFRTLDFPYQGKIVNIDQLNYCITNSTTCSVDNVLLVGDFQLSYESVGVGLLKYSTLMGNFSLPTPTPSTLITQVNTISSMVHQSLGSLDPWVVPTLSQLESFSDIMPLNPVEVA